MTNSDSFVEAIRKMTTLLKEEPLFYP